MYKRLFEGSLTGELYNNQTLWLELKSVSGHKQTGRICGKERSHGNVWQKTKNQ